MSTTDTFSHYHFVPDRMLDGNLGVDPASVRWHVVEQRWSGVGAGARRLDDYVTSFATIQDALALYGIDTKNPVIPCGLFAECEHCAKAMADEAPMAHESPCTVCGEAATDAIDGICEDCLHAAHDALEDIAAADNADQWDHLEDGRTQALLILVRDQDIARFWSKVERRGDDECWPWLAKKDRNGYGSLRFRNGFSVSSHRFSFFLKHGALPVHNACHTCDNPTCCNPAHLYDGTHADNHRQRGEHGRTARGENAGPAKLKEADIPIIRSLVTSGMSLAAVSRQYGVGRTCIRDIINGKSWTHVPHDTEEENGQYEVFWRRMLREYHALAAAVALVAALLVPLHASAADELVAPHPINGSTYVWPAIAGEADCAITRFFEDGSASAHCASGTTYAYDPDGQSVPNIPGNPITAPGWHVAA